MAEKLQLRYVIVRGVRYIHEEDVALLIRELGSGEETDVRNRLNQGADILLLKPERT